MQSSDKLAIIIKTWNAFRLGKNYRIMKFDKNISLRNLVEAKKIFEELKTVLSESDPYFLKANILLERLEKMVVLFTKDKKYTMQI